MLRQTPLKPLKILVSPQTEQKVTLSWQKGSDRPNSHLQYEILRRCTSSDCNSNWEELTTLTPQSTQSSHSYVDYCVIPDKSYEYKIRTNRVSNNGILASSSWVKFFYIT